MTPLLHGTAGSDLVCGLREGRGLELEPGHFQNLWVSPLSIISSGGKWKHIILNGHSCLGDK